MSLWVQSIYFSFLPLPRVVKCGQKRDKCTPDTSPKSFVEKKKVTNQTKFMFSFSEAFLQLEIVNMYLH